MDIKQSDRAGLIGRSIWLRGLVVALAMGSFVAMGSPAEAARTNFLAVGTRPRLSDQVKIRNGAPINLTATLYTVVRNQNVPVPNQSIDFYVYVNGQRTYAGSATTNDQGVAVLSFRSFRYPGQIPKTGVRVMWGPRFEGRAPYTGMDWTNQIHALGFQVFP